MVSIVVGFGPHIRILGNSFLEGFSRIGNWYGSFENFTLIVLSWKREAWAS
jgi:hypothetical protein